MYTVYKVVREFGGLYFSCTAPGKYKTVYELNVTSKCHPDTKGLFVFTDLDRAKVWRYVTECEDTILKCLCRAKPKKQKMRAGLYFEEWAIDDFWSVCHKSTPNPAPTGTYIVPTLTPIEVVS